MQKAHSYIEQARAQERKEKKLHSYKQNHCNINIQFTAYCSLLALLICMHFWGGGGGGGGEGRGGEGRGGGTFWQSFACAPMPSLFFQAEMVQFLGRVIERQLA